MHQPYEGPNDIHISDSSGLKITHASSVSFSPSFNLSNVLYVPSIKQNLILVSKFCRSNKTCIEFFPSYFVGRDLLTGIPLLHGKKRHDLYEWPTTGSANNNHVVAFSAGVVAPASQAIWHGRLRHPSLKILNKLVQFGSISLSRPFSSDVVCHSCLCNMSQCLPFGESSLESRGFLDLIYTDV